MQTSTTDMRLANQSLPLSIKWPTLSAVMHIRVKTYDAMMVGNIAFPARGQL
jgi:hypothetical protein